MPELDGYETTALIRSREAKSGGHVPVVALTANAMDGDRERCIAAGMDDYLSKPLRPEQLDAVLERWLGVPAASVPVTDDRGASDALVDEARVRVLRDDYPEIVPQLIELFVNGTPPLLAELRAGVERGDGDATRRAAHKLKGSCQSIGASRMTTLAGELEQAAAVDPAALAALDTAFEATQPALRVGLAV